MMPIVPKELMPLIREYEKYIVDIKFDEDDNMIEVFSDDTPLKAKKAYEKAQKIQKKCSKIYRMAGNNWLKSNYDER